MTNMQVLGWYSIHRLIKLVSDLVEEHKWLLVIAQLALVIVEAMGENIFIKLIGYRLHMPISLVLAIFAVIFFVPAEKIFKNYCPKPLIGSDETQGSEADIQSKLQDSRSRYLAAKEAMEKAFSDEKEMLLQSTELELESCASGFSQAEKKVVIDVVRRAIESRHTSKMQELNVTFQQDVYKLDLRSLNQSNPYARFFCVALLAASIACAGGDVGVVGYSLINSIQ